MAEYDGKALKVLVPADYHPGEGDYRAIWIDRDCKEQAKSWVKVQQARFGVSGDVPAITRKLRKDRERHVAALKKLTPHVMLLKFEGLLKEPKLWCGRLAEFVGGLDADTMADVVVPRKPQCIDGILERSLLKMGPPPERQGQEHG